MSDPRVHLDRCLVNRGRFTPLWTADHVSGVRRGSRPEVAAFCPGEATEVVLGSGVMPISLTRAVPQELVPGLRWQSGRRPERGIRHLAPDGRIERSLSLQGIYRLTPESEAALLALA